MRYRKRIARSLAAAALAFVMTAGVAFAAAGTATVTADSLRLREGPGTDSQVLANVPKGSSVEVLSGPENGWYQVSWQGKVGYMSADWLDVTMLSAANAATTEPAQEEPPANGEEPAANGEEPAAQSGSAVTPVVTADALNVRTGPGTEYDRVGVLKKGDKVTILTTCDNGWYEVTDGTLTGYVSGQYISLDGFVPQEGLVMTSSLNVRSGPGTGYSRVGSLRMGSTVTILDAADGWYQITSGSLSGYVCADYVVVMEDLGSSPLGAAAAAMAISLVGSRYVYGSAGPNSFDCSGLSYYIYKQLGRTLSRGSSGQYKNNGSFVPLSQVEPGDLIFIFDPRFDGSGGTLPTTHMGIYVGNGRFIHASTTTYRVQYDNLYGSYYTPYIVGAKRIS